MSINPEASLPPGFRFHPTDAELILHYLKNRVTSRPCPVAIIAEVDIYKFNPWDLPAKAPAFGDKEWYFFTPRERKYPNGIRPNRAAASGYWKATGTDRPIVTSSGPGARMVTIGVKKALVFYRGKPPKGRKTGWIMHEYRLAEAPSNNNSNFRLRPMKDKDASMRLDDWVLCRIYEKTGQPTSTQTATDQEQEDSNVVDDSYMPILQSISQQNNYRFPKPPSLGELFQNGEMLSHLLYDNPPEAYRLGQHGVNQTPYFSKSSSSNCNNGISMPMDPIPPKREADDVLMASSLKRHASSGEEGDGSLPLHQSKKCNSTGSTATNFNNQFINTFDQPHVNQNLWSYHLGLH